MSLHLSGIPCAHVVLGPSTLLVARGFQLQKIGMPFAIVLGRVQFRLIPLRASPDSHSGLHMADQTKDTVSFFNLSKYWALQVGSAVSWKVLGWASWELKGFDLPSQRGTLFSA